MPTTAPAAGQPLAAAPRRRWLWSLAAVALALVVYGRAVGFAFVHDDRVLIEGSLRLADLSQLPRALVHDLFWLAGGDVRPSPYWRPVVVCSYFLDQLLGGGAPWSFHLHNVLMAAAVGGTLAWAQGWRGLLAAAVFLVHPMQVEAVTNITARTDLWCAVWGTLAVFAAGLPGAVLTALALGCKETAIIVPVVAWLGAPGGPAGRRHWLPHLGVLGVWAVVRTVLVAGWEVDGADRGGPTLASLLAAPGVWVEDLARLAWPWGSTIARLPAQPGAAQVLGGVVVAGVVAALMWRGAPGLRRALGLLVLPLVPVSGLLTSPVRYAEGFLSWPLVGLALLSLRWPRQAALGLAAVVVVVWMPLSLHRVPEWRSPETVWEAAHSRHPDDPRAALGLARVVMQSEPGRALTLAKQSADGEPDARKAREARALVGNLELARGDQDAALEALQRATPPDALRDPEGRWARTARCVLGADREPPAAIEPVCAAAVRERADDADLWNAAGLVAVRAEDWRLAVERFSAASRLQPERADFRANAERAAAMVPRR